MTAFSHLPLGLQLSVAWSVYVAAMAALMVLLFQISYKAVKWRFAVNCLHFIVLAVISVLLSVSANMKSTTLILLPFSGILLFSLCSLLYSLNEFVHEYQKGKNRISPVSVKQALDHLETGILFSDSIGRTVLINHAMARLIVPILGSYPQTLSELKTALKKLRQIADAQFLWQTPDGKIWQVQTIPLTEPGLAGFHQTTAQDVTALYNDNLLLQRENSGLKETNEKMRQMLERLADRIREEETLALKAQIHNDIGASLISLSKLFENGSEEDVDTQLARLQNAVTYFSDNRLKTAENSIFTVLKKAEEMGVKLILNGDWQPCEELAAGLALECVTNCVKHGKGNQVTVDIIKTGDNGVILRATNNGKMPQKPISEGGGLSALRRKVENAGAKLEFCYEPEFAVIVTVKGENNETNNCS